MLRIWRLVHEANGGANGSTKKPRKTKGDQENAPIWLEHQSDQAREWNNASVPTQQTRSQKNRGTERCADYPYRARPAPAENPDEAADRNSQHPRDEKSFRVVVQSPRNEIAWKIVHASVFA